MRSAGPRFVGTAEDERWGLELRRSPEQALQSRGKKWRSTAMAHQQIVLRQGGNDRRTDLQTGKFKL